MANNRYSLRGRCIEMNPVKATDFDEFRVWHPKLHGEHGHVAMTPKLSQPLVSEQMVFENRHRKHDAPRFEAAQPASTNRRYIPRVREVNELRHCLAPYPPALERREKPSAESPYLSIKS